MDEREALREALMAAERLLCRALVAKGGDGRYSYIQARDGSMLEATAVINAARAALSQPAQGEWQRTATRRPVAGQLIVKRWDRTGAVWAGVYSGTEKDSSFDEWFALPAAAATPEVT